MMLISTPLTRRLGIRHPILLAPMDIVADARSTWAVTDTVGLGILEGGYGDEQWLRRELGIVPGRAVPFGVEFIKSSLAKHPPLLEMALACKKAAVMLSLAETNQFIDRIKGAGA